MTIYRHRNHLNSVLAVVTIAASGCTSESGLDGTTKLVSLSTAEQTDECNYLHAQMPPKTVTCSDGSSQSIGDTETIAECVSKLQTSIAETPNCAATVADYEGCLEALYNEPGSSLCPIPTIPPECKPLYTADCIPPTTEHPTDVRPLRAHASSRSAPAPAHEGIQLAVTQALTTGMAR